MSKTGGHEPTLLGSLVAGTRADLIRAGGCPLDAHTWQRAIGDRIAARSQPEQLRDGVLTLRVASSVWAQELSLLSSTIIERLAPLGFAIRTIRCKVASLDASSKPKPSPRKPVAVAPVQLPAELAQQLDQIRDDDLKATIETAARAQLQMRAQRLARPAPPRGPQRK